MTMILWMFLLVPKQSCIDKQTKDRIDHPYLIAGGLVQEFRFELAPPGKLKMQVNPGDCYDIYVSSQEFKGHLWP